MTGVGVGGAAAGATAAYASEQGDSDGYRGWGNTQKKAAGIDGFSAGYSAPNTSMTTSNPAQVSPLNPSPYAAAGAAAGAGTAAGAAGAANADDRSSTYSQQSAHMPDYSEFQPNYSDEALGHEDSNIYEPPPVIRNNEARRSVSESTTPTRQSRDLSSGIHAAF